MKPVLHTFLVVVALVALFWQVIGPALDPHFAARHPYHGHLSLGPVDPDHVHPHQLLRGPDEKDGKQEHARASRAPSPPKHDTSHPDVVYLAPRDGAAPSAVAVLSTVMYAALPPGLAGGDGGFGTPDDDALPAGASIAPPDRPPAL